MNDIKISDAIQKSLLTLKEGRLKLETELSRDEEARVVYGNEMERPHVGCGQ
jgi:hypothetical protein